MYCLMEFCKMSFPIHFDFSLLAGIIIRPLFTTFCSCFLSFSRKNHFFHIRHMVLHKMFLEFLSRKKWFLASTATSCSSLFLIVYDILHNFIFKMFHHFFQSFLTFFICYSTRWLLNLLEKKCFLAFTATLCSSQWFTTLYACYSTRCLLNLLENKRFLHSMHVIAQDVS